mgnify:CR=1 FL=1
MDSAKYSITQDEAQVKKAIEKLDNFAGQMKLTHREVLHLNLLTEETLGMLRAILDYYDGQMWFEEENGQVKLFFSVKASMSPEKRESLIQLSRDGKNSASRGIMGKIGTIIANSLSDYGSAMDVSSEYGGTPISYWRMGVDVPTDNMEMNLYDWSLNRYRNSVSELRQESGGEEDAWDELEKSIVGRLADDVRVGVRGGKVSIMILRKLPEPYAV